MIYVRSKPDRVAFESLRGRKIPSDKFVAVAETEHIKRLIEVHGDIEVQQKPKYESLTSKPPKDKPMAIQLEDKKEIS
jgi:hypothetical protein